MTKVQLLRSIPLLTMVAVVGLVPSFALAEEPIDSPFVEESGADAIDKLFPEEPLIGPKEKEYEVPDVSLPPDVTVPEIEGEMKGPADLEESDPGGYIEQMPDGKLVLIGPQQLIPEKEGDEFVDPFFPEEKLIGPKEEEKDLFVPGDMTELSTPKVSLPGTIEPDGGNSPSDKEEDKPLEKEDVEPVEPIDPDIN